MTHRSMKDLFLLDKRVTFLNHGSFGATPRPVFDTYLHWQRRLEKQPVQLLGREYSQEMDNVKRVLGKTINAEAGDLLMVPNATFAVNMVARSLNFRNGDELLTTSHEYGACMNIWNCTAADTGATLIVNHINMPFGTPDDIFEEIWSGITDRTQLIFLSHITSPTAAHLPVERICKEARSAGILTFIDGAHGPGQIDLDMERIDADFYTGNCHKWMLAPKSCAFLHIRSEHQHLVHPLVVSWGWNNGPDNPERSLLQNLQWMGTIDPSAIFSIPAAIRFQQDHNWESVRKWSQEVLQEYLPVFSDTTGITSVYDSESPQFIQMAAIPLPKLEKPYKLQEQLLKRFRIEIPVTECNGRHFLRISFQAYNTRAELDYLADALKELLPVAG